MKYKLWLNKLKEIPFAAKPVDGGWYFEPVGVYSNLPLYGRTKDIKRAKLMGYSEALATCQSFTSSGYKCRLVPRIKVVY